MRLRVPTIPILIPLMLRLPLCLFLTILLVVSSIVTLRQASASGIDCIAASLRQVDITSERMFAPRSKTWANTKDRFIPLNTPFGIRPVSVWAVHGSRHAYLEYAGSWGMVPTRLTITSPAEGLHRQFNTTSYIPNGNVLGYIWSGQDDGYHVPIQYLIWSPDGNYILYAHYEGQHGIYQPAESARWTYSLFGIDGTAFYQFTSIPHQPDTLSQWRAVWASDSRAVIFPQYGEKPLVLDVPSLRMSIADSGILSSDRRIALPTRTDGKTTIALMNLDGTQPVTLIEGADDAGDPSWSPDGKYVAVVWSTGREQYRKVRLTWARSDGSDAFTLADNFWDVRDLLWLKDGESLLYVVRRKDGVRVEIADLDTGAVRRLGTLFKDIAQVEQNPSNERITYWWQHQTDIGIATYAFNGQRLYYTRLQSLIEGLEIFRNPYMFQRWPEIYRSPDGSTYAIRRHLQDMSNGTVGYGSLELIAADGSWSRRVAKNSDGFSDPIWSPDSKRLAFVEWNRSGYNPFRIVTAQGDQLQDIDSLSGTTNFFWTQCG